MDRQMVESQIAELNGLRVGQQQRIERAQAAMDEARKEMSFGRDSICKIDGALEVCQGFLRMMDEGGSPPAAPADDVPSGDVPVGTTFANGDGSPVKRVS